MRLLFFFFLFSSICSFGQEEWTKLGFGKGKYEMTKNKCHFTVKKKEIGEFKLVVHGLPVRVYKLTVKFSNGLSKTFSINETFNHDKPSKSFKFRKSNLTPIEIQVIYKRKVNHKMAPKFIFLGK